MSETDQSIARRFATLDDYLAWLERNEAPAGGAWYREVRPGIYELQVSGNLHLEEPGGAKTTFTRAELEAKFGFNR